MYRALFTIIQKLISFLQKKNSQKVNILEIFSTFEKKLMKKNYLVIIILFGFMILGCANRSSQNAESSNVYSYEVQSYEEPEGQANVAGGEQVKLDLAVTERKLIKEGSISFETENIEQTRTRIEELVKKSNGYISREYSYDYTEEKRYDMTVRIPADKFDVFVNGLSGMIVKLDNKDIQVRDVTEEYVDIESRIKTKKDLLNRYTELLKQAKTVAEMMDVEREIGNIQAELESLQGRINVLKNQVSYSTLSISFYEKRSSEFGFFKKIGKAFDSGWNGLLWFFVGVIYLWPLWLFLGIIAWVIVRIIRKKSSKH